jgi:hypothetical protein
VSEKLLPNDGGRDWCSYCQCYHKRPFPSVKVCRAKEPEHQRRAGLIPDMLDYN